MIGIFKTETVLTGWAATFAWISCVGIVGVIWSVAAGYEFQN
jgi:hypothetical protein